MTAPGTPPNKSNALALGELADTSSEAPSPKDKPNPTQNQAPTSNVVGSPKNGPGGNALTPEPKKIAGSTNASIPQTPQVSQANKDQFGDKKADQPPVVAKKDGTATKPAANVQAAKKDAQKKIAGAKPSGSSGTDNTTGSLTSAGNASSAANANSTDSTKSDLRRRGTGASVGKAPHYFKEQTDQVFFPDVLVYVCGANVTPHLKGSVSISLGLNDSINTARFTLDNGNDKFVITPENVFQNKFLAGGNPDTFRDYDESAKAKIYLYKNNSLPIPGTSRFYVPNTPQDDTAGRRLPLNIYGTIFHRMDPVRIWVRSSPFDEWIPAFTGYITTHAMSDDWVTHSREISISCSDIREAMRKMRVQHNTVLFQLPGDEQITEARTVKEPDLVKNSGGLSVSAANPTGTTAVDRDGKFWADVLRTDSAFDIPWVNIPFTQLAQLMTTGGFISSGLTVGQENPIKRKRIDFVEKAIKQIDEDIKTLSQSQQAYDANKTARANLTGLAATAAEINDTFGGPGSTPDESFGLGKIALEKREADQARIAQITKIKEQYQKELEKLKKELIVTAAGGDSIRGLGRMAKGIVVRYPSATSSDKKAIEDNKAILDYWYKLCLYGSPTREKLVSKGVSVSQDEVRVGINPIASRVEKPTNYDEFMGPWSYREIVDPLTGAGTRSRWDDVWAPDNQLVHYLLPSNEKGGGPIGNQLANLYSGRRDYPNRDPNLSVGGSSGTDRSDITEQVLITESNVASSRSWTSRFDLLDEFARIVDYKFWVTGCGDIVFEFPMYDFDAVDFGNWEDVLTIDLHATSSTLDEEAGDPPTIVVATGSFTTMPSTVGESAIYSYVPPPFGIVRAPNLMSRLGVKIETVNYPWLSNVKRLQQLAVLKMQQSIGQMENSSIGFAWRPWIIPNKPVRFAPRERVSLITGVTHTMNIHQECSTEIELQYTRMLDLNGIRRYVTGGANMPIAFSVVPGNSSITLTAALKAKIKRTNAVSKLFIEKFNNPDLKAKQRAQTAILSAELAEDTKDGIPEGYNSFNVLPAGDRSTGRAFEDFVARNAQATTAVPNAVTIEPGGIVGFGTTGIDTTSTTKPSKPTSSGSSPAVTPVSVGQVTSVEGAEAIVSGKNAQATAAAIASQYNANGADVLALAQVIQGETKGVAGVTDQDRINIGNVARNSAVLGAKGTAIKSDNFSGKFAQALKNSRDRGQRGDLNIATGGVSEKDLKIAAAILQQTQGFEDKTGGSTRLARNTGTSFDKRGCDSLIRDQTGIEGSVGATDVGGGNVFDTNRRFVFFSRDISRDRKTTTDSYTTGTGTEKAVKLEEPYNTYFEITRLVSDNDIALACLYLARVNKVECGGMKLDGACGRFNPLSGTVGFSQIRPENFFKCVTTAKKYGFPIPQEVSDIIDTDTNVVKVGSDTRPRVFKLKTASGDNIKYIASQAAKFTVVTVDSAGTKLSTEPYEFPKALLDFIIDPKFNIGAGIETLKSFLGNFKSVQNAPTTDLGIDLDATYNFGRYSGTQAYLGVSSYCLGAATVQALIERGYYRYGRFLSQQQVDVIVAQLPGYNPKTQANVQRIARDNLRNCGGDEDLNVVIPEAYRLYQLTKSLEDSKAKTPFDACVAGQQAGQAAASQVVNNPASASDTTKLNSILSSSFKRKKLRLK